MSFESLAENYYLWYILILGLLYYLTTHTYGYWASKGVPFATPLPFFGNGLKYILMIEPAFKIQNELYKKFKDKPFFGFYEFLSPILVLRDPELIEKVTIKDFPIWMNRGDKINPKLDPLSVHLVSLEGSKWKSLRTKMTPVFSSGKLKMMLDQVISCSDHMVTTMTKLVAQDATIEVKNKMSGFTMDVIGSCAFGLDLNVLENPDAPFMAMGKKIFDPSIKAKIRRFARNHFPVLLSLLQIRGIPKKMEDYFVNTLRDTVKHREDNNLHRNDFIQLMMEIRKQEQALKTNPNEVILDDTTFAANAFVFLIAGFETTATTLSYLLFELSKKPEIQQKLYEEINRVEKKHEGKLSWETLKDLHYLDQCICETLRKNPPVWALRRTNLQPYRIPDSNVELPAGSSIVIPVHSLHHDPQYYPDPEEFIPERFSEENKPKIHKSTYLPFGDGPRICIGLRFAKVEMKIAMMKLISNFTFKLNPRTLDPLQFSASAILSSPVGGIWIDFTPRKKRE